METQQTYNTKLRNVEERLWQKELEIIAEDNDFLLGLLTSLQTERVITHKFDEKTSLFFNHFQYFYYQTKHLKNGIELIAKQDLHKQKNKKERLREEVDALVERFKVFKNNFKVFLNTLTVNKPIFTCYL